MKTTRNSDANEPKKNSKSESKKNEPIKLAFNPESHDQKVDTRRAEESKSKARELVSRHFLEWKRKLQRQIKKKEIQTQQQLIASLYELHGVVAREASSPEMFEWRSFTMDLIEDKISEIIRTNGWKLNMFTEYLPEVKATDALAVPQQYTFETLEDFLKIPFLTSFREKQGFVGFIRDQRIVYGFFKDGEMVRAGIVAQVKGLEALPTKYEVERDLKKAAIEGKDSE